MQVQKIQTTQFIKCPLCQTDILILPDIKAMTKAIEEHAKQHAPQARYKRAQLINNLTQQLLIQVIKSDESQALPQLYLLIESYFGVKRTLGIALSREAAEIWVDAQHDQNPDGSYFYEKGAIYTGAE